MHVLSKYIALHKQNNSEQHAWIELNASNNTASALPLAGQGL